MRLSIAVCDDEKPQREYIGKLLSEWGKERGHMTLVSLYESASDFFTGYDLKQFDILLLDIEMGKDAENGISLARRLRERDDRSQIIFITGYPDYAAEGYEVEALRYLMKPVSYAKLAEVLDRACGRLSAKDRTLLVSSEGEYIRVALGDIAYAEITGHYAELHLANRAGEVIRTRMTMSELEKKLGEGFFRCQRSFIVNIEHIGRISRSAVTLTDGSELPLSRGLYDMANRAFIDYGG